MSEKYPDSEFEVTLDESYSKEQREAIAAEIISFVRQTHT
jgi:protein involved in sex pheromone biosynthesis